MNITQTIIENLKNYLYNKKILEIACGNSDFSLIASKFAKNVLATDISLERVVSRNLKSISPNIEFKEMNATNLDIHDNVFDVTVCYNSLGHLENILTSILIEMVRVTVEGGYLLFIATWKIDRVVMDELKSIISTHSNLILFTDTSDKKYRTLIIKKGAV